MNTTISVDVQGKDGKYDVWIATEGGSGAHYHDIDATKIGEYTADLVDTLEEAESGKSYLKSDNLQLPLNNDVDVSELVGQMVDAILYGSDYDALASSIKATLKSWGIIRR